MTMICKYCRSTKLVKRRKEPHIGVYCVACGKWQQWVKQDSPKFEEVPWDSGFGKSIKQLIVDDTIKLPEDTEISPEALKILKHSYYGVSAMSEEEFKTVIEARFPTKAKIVEAHSDPDKPPWED